MCTQYHHLTQASTVFLARQYVLSCLLLLHRLPSKQCSQEMNTNVNCISYSFNTFYISFTTNFFISLRLFLSDSRRFQARPWLEKIVEGFYSLHIKSSSPFRLYACLLSPSVEDHLVILLSKFWFSAESSTPATFQTNAKGTKTIKISSWSFQLKLRNVQTIA